MDLSHVPRLLRPLKPAWLLLASFLLSASLAPPSLAVEKNVPFGVMGEVDGPGSFTLKVVNRPPLVPAPGFNMCDQDPLWSIVVPVDDIPENGIPSSGLEVMDYLNLGSVGSGLTIDRVSCGPASGPFVNIFGNTNFAVCVDGEVIRNTSEIQVHGLSILLGTNGCTGGGKSKVPSISGFLVTVLVLLLGFAGIRAAQRGAHGGGAPA